MLAPMRLLHVAWLGLLCAAPIQGADNPKTDSPAVRTAMPFILGADISWVPEQESQGRRFSMDGVGKDVLAILKENGFNWVRLRLFHTPNASNGYSPKGFCGLEPTLAMAARVKQAGFKLLLNFHYSDTWADPAHQTKPAAWRDLDFAGLSNAVHRYTREVLTEFRRRQVAPDMVQVGNEISHGLLWPDGKTSDWDKLAALLQAGLGAVREASPSTPVMLHLALGGQNRESRWFLDNALQRGLDFDIIGQSYYPRWHGTIEDLRANLIDLAGRYRQSIIVVEYSMPNAREVNEIVQALPGGKGLGSFIWEPTHPGHGNLFDKEGRARPEIREYRQFRERFDNGLPSNPK